MWLLWQSDVLMKFVIFFFLSLLTFLLSSCIDGEEEIHINADGSARMKAMYSLPALIFSDEDAASLRELIEREIGKEETVDLLTNTVEKVSGKQIITIEVETADTVSYTHLTLPTIYSV